MKHKLKTFFKAPKTRTFQRLSDSFPKFEFLEKRCGYIIYSNGVRNMSYYDISNALSFVRSGIWEEIT